LTVLTKFCWRQQDGSPLLRTPCLSVWDETDLGLMLAVLASIAVHISPYESEPVAHPSEGRHPEVVVWCVEWPSCLEECGGCSRRKPQCGEAVRLACRP